MSVIGVDHVQLAMPEGGEEAARTFYGQLLGLAEVAKPPLLAARGGCWFEEGSVKVHLGVERDFMPARKAHVAFLVRDLPGLRQRLADAGIEARDHQPLEGYDRTYVADPFGNRVELMEQVRRSSFSHNPLCLGQTADFRLCSRILQGPHHPADHGQELFGLLG